MFKDKLRVVTMYKNMTNSCQLKDTQFDHCNCAPNVSARVTAGDNLGRYIYISPSLVHAMPHTDLTK